ncbi:MAG: bifunctional tRNA (5-methylaminomethyl-2-thiouridine)(34)-methyltransferase MnmD/FAD-dependent 5-carboxymethylaminomethyl-2-thiouridine(34) oxidoreductase MnmC, partial [Motiliproteus sp.]
EAGLPFSSHYKDAYFSLANGLEETRYVFLQNNQLPQRWQQLTEQQCFTIAETGFGTGLNFLTTWLCWRESAPKNARLHFLSVEKHPLTIEDLQQSLKLWPQLSELSAQLIESYPHLCPGHHRISFDDGRVQLTLMLGDAEQMYESLQGRVDAWYLDGFSPAKNPQMWSERLFAAMAAHSHDHTTFSTFTAASVVSKAATAQGFNIEKAAGFGNKREMLKGVFRYSQTPAIERKPWFSLPPTATVSQQKALVIGAGIAGCSSARALANRGWEVELIDRHKAIAQEASGNDQGVLYAKLPAVPTLQSRIHLSGYMYSLRLLQRLLPEQESWDSCGVLQLALNPQEQKKQQKLLDLNHYPRQLVTAVDSTRASQIAGVQVPHPGLYFPDSGWINPPSLCRALTEHKKIKLSLGQSIKTLQQKPDSKIWQALDAAGAVIAEAPIVIVATAREATDFPELQQLPLKSIRGQVSSLPQPLETQLNCVVCGNSYISPPHNGRFCFGATFDLHSKNQQLCLNDHQENLSNTLKLIPELAQQLQPSDSTQWQGRVGFRCTSPDYLPLIGPAANHQAFVESYAELRNNAKAIIPSSPQHHDGLYVSLGHGSKGMITAPLAAEILASQISGDPLPIERELLDALNPSRFIIKDLIRRAI